MEHLLENSFLKKLDKTKLLFRFITVIGILGVGYFVFWAMEKGYFLSIQSFSRFVTSLGLMAPIIFVLVQVIQVIFPILPGAIGCAAGVIAFGPVMGFILNYIGICIGSLIAFLIAKKYGVALVKKIVNERSLNKYLGWLEKGKKFEKMFATAIFLPVAPDDLLCFLAGLTRIKFLKFTMIILICKPFSILLYSIGLTKILQIFIF